MNGEPQYDCSLGGTQELDSKLNLLHFASARAKEIQAMKASLQETTSTKLAFQRLPKHMRRRVMSHNAKRLPRRLREIHIKQLQKSGLTIQLKKSTRRYRRRANFLLNEFVRRQTTKVWLETHIWHAKRFHMTDKWGFRLADRACDKAFRACYRASTKHCLVQDLSYFACVEISGPREILVNNFKTICDSNVDLNIGAKAYIRGNREGKVTLFNNQLDIKRAIGSVYFNWRPVNQEEPTLEYALWIWIHAAYYSEALDLLIKCFNLNVYVEGAGMHLNKTLKVSLIELKNSLNRFRLTGPLSTAVLRNTLKTLPTSEISSPWFKSYLNNTANLEIYTKQCDYWKDIENLSASELPSHIILCLTVSDPRHNLPKTKKKAVLEPLGIKNTELPEDIAHGLIWSQKIRDEVKENKISNAKFAHHRSQLLVPGSDIEGAKDVVPVMLIQRPGDQDKYIGYNSGWDLIVPSGWGNTFWMSLIMWGGRAGGLREFNNVRFESGQTPFLEPDTQAGLKEETEIQEVYENKFFSLPPNKRPNYTKFGTTEPFHINWKRLVNEWSSVHMDKFSVLREKQFLTQIQEILTSRKKHLAKPPIDYNKNCIVPIRLKLTKKGIIKRFARIYLIEPSDVSSHQVIREPLHVDPNQATRKQMRDSHKKLLKRLKRQRKSAKSKHEVQVLNQNYKGILESYKQKMKKLWLPDLNQSVRKLCCRETIGFITTGDFSFTQANSCAVGYIAMGAVQALLSKSTKNKVLVRNIASRQYRLAELEVIV